MSLRIAEFRIERPRDVTQAAQRARLLGSVAGVPHKHRTGLGKALAEIARNAIAYAGGGNVEFCVTRHEGRQFIEAVVRDRGPGIGELASILAEKSLEAGRRGAGIRRARAAVDRFSITSNAKAGTVVRLGQSLPAGAPEVTDWIAADWATALASRSTQNALIASFQRILELDGKLSMAQRQGVDLQQELQNLKALNETLELLALVASKTDNAVIIMDRQGRVEWVNDGFVRMTDYDLADIVGKQAVEILLGQQTDPIAVQEIEDAFRHEHGLSQEVLLYRKDKRAFWASVSMTPVCDEGGELTRWISISSDVTRRRQAQEALERAREAAEAASRAKSEFLANMSHEIRTPMNAIIGMTELALCTELSPEQREYLATARDSAESLLLLLNDILDLSKIEAGKMEIDSVDFNLTDLLRETMKALGVRAGQKGLEVAWDMEPEVPDRLVGDPARLRQILINVVGNAIKFTREGEVVVRVEPQWQTEADVSLHFSVSDTGVGIPADRLERIFEAFAQVDSSTSRRFGGTGLGLTISSQLIELMGGHIWVQSEVDEGSTFHFTVRLGLCSQEEGETETETEPEPEPAPEPPPAVAIPLRVLVADDNTANRVLAARILQKRGHHVTAVASGHEALAAIEREPFDVVLMDVQMPDMDGFATTAAIREKESHSGGHLPIVAMTAYAMKGDCDRCLAAGMDAYVAKPVRARELQALVENIGAVSHCIEELSAAGPPEFDFAPALTRLEGDVELLKEQMAFFLNDAPALLDDLRTATDRSDGKALQLAAHRLKGLASGFDAEAVVGAAEQLETMGRRGDFSQAAALCDQLAADVGRLRQAIERFRATH